MNAFRSLPLVLWFISFLLAVLGDGDASESCKAPSVHKIGVFPVSTIVVVDDFLGTDRTTRQAHEEIKQRRDRRPVIPDHQGAFAHEEEHPRILNLLYRKQVFLGFGGRN